MLRFTRFDGSLEDWGKILVTCPDYEIFQTPAWIRFVAEAQRARPVLAVLKDGNDTVGYFAGLQVRKFGMKILGSPFVGWNTAFMGIRLIADVPRRAAVEALTSFAFHDLGCFHLEFSDRNITPPDLDGLGFEHSMWDGFRIDLTMDADKIYQEMSDKSCRYAIRKSARMGVTIEEAHDEAFADDYYAQLQDVFAKQSLAPTYDKRRVQLLLKHVLPTGNILLLRARDPAGRCIATGIFLGANRFAFFWGNASWRQDQHLSPNEGLHWYAIQYWKARGAQSYDLAGGSYKKKYGGAPCAGFVFRKSRYAWIAKARAFAQRSFKTKQKLLGWLKRD